MNVGDIVKAGNDVRILVYDMVDQYYLINTRGEAASCSFKSLDEAEDYCSQIHPANLAKDYPGRCYRKTGSLRNLLGSDPNVAVVDLMLNSVRKFGADKQKHAAASNGAFIFFGEGVPDEDEYHVLKTLLLAFVDTLALGLRKEYSDAGRSPSEIDPGVDMVREKIINARVVENLDQGDLLADLVGAAMALMNMAYRNMELYNEKR